MEIRSGLLLGLCCLSWSLSAQRMAVQGTVVDSSGEPVIGANVIVRGSSAGVATDLDGRFRLDVVPDATLVVSYLGYNTQEVPVNNRSQITIVLQENAVALQEVVAIGYGTVRKSDATGSVTLVKPDEINAGLATSAQDLLVGKTPGVVVTLNGGKPEGGADIRIRGGSSLNATNDPLIVIDGVPVDNSGVTGMSNSLSMISPDNIESFTILKDASATAIYGSRASNGVIIITTKRGQSGKPQINFTANMYVNTPRNKVGVLDGDQFRQVITDYYGEGSPAYNLLGTANTNWQDEILRTSVSSDYNLSVGGTYKILPYRVAVSYTNQNGILKTSAMDRVTASITLNPKFFDNTLSVTANVKGFYMHNRFADEGAIGGAVSFDPSQSVRVDNLPIGNGYFTWLKPGTDEFIGIAPVNPVSLIDERSMKADVYRSVGNLQLVHSLAHGVDGLFGLRHHLGVVLLVQHDQHGLCVIVEALQLLEAGQLALQVAHLVKDLLAQLSVVVEAGARHGVLQLLHALAGSVDGQRLLQVLYSGVVFSQLYFQFISGDHRFIPLVSKNRSSLFIISHAHGQARLSTTSQSRWRSTAPLVGEPLAKPFTLRGLPKPPLQGEVASRQR